MTLVGDGLIRARQKEILCRGSSFLYPTGCTPRTPGNLDSHCAQEASLRHQRCSRWSLIPGAPSAAVLSPRVYTARPRKFFRYLCLPCPICIPRSKVYWEFESPQCPPNGELHKASLAPKQNAQVTEEPLTCFPLCCLSLLSPPLHKPFQKGGEKSGAETGTRAAPQAGCGCASPAAPPAQLCAASQREVGSAGSGPLARPRNYWFLPRLVPFIDSAVPSAGVTTGQTLFSPSFLRPLSGLCLCSSVTQQKARGDMARPLNRRQCAAAGTGGAWCKLCGVCFP